MLCLRTRVLAIVACYYPPNRDVSDILDDLADGIAKLSNCGTPIVIAGDFNCRIDSGTRGYELSSALSGIGFTCHNDPAHHTYISKQGVSTIDLVFTDSVSDHKFRVDVRPALETKHQHVSVVFDDQLDKYDTRCDTIRRVDYATLGRKCDMARIQESLTAGGDFSDRVDAANGVITGRYRPKYGLSTSQNYCTTNRPHHPCPSWTRGR